MPLWTIGGYAVTLFDPNNNGRQEDATTGQPPIATVQLMCPDAGRYVVFSGLMGTCTGGPGAIVRSVPAWYPPSPNLYCTAISNAQGIRYQGGWTYNQCSFTATFTRLSYDIPGALTGANDPSGAPFTSTRTRVSAQVTQVPMGAFKWTSGADSGKDVMEAQLGIVVPHSEYTIQRHLMPYIPINECETYVGSVNSVNVSIGNRTYTPGQLLFAGMSGTEGADPAGNRTYEVEYTVLGVKGHTWNQLLDRGLVWTTVNTKSDNSGNPPFASLDFWNNLP